MGIYDREYYRQERGGIQLGLPQSVVATLILTNAALWLADGLLFPEGRPISRTLMVPVGSLFQPWLWWQFLTYGFVHAPHPAHLLFNMLGLFFFGRTLEERFGRWEFLRFYLAAIVVAGVVWAALELASGAPLDRPAVGASGGVVATVILFALLYPRATVLLFFVLPVPAWVMGVMLVAFDALGAVQRTGNVAFTAHLAGAAFAFLYFRFQWNLGRLAGRFSSLGDRFRRPPRRPGGGANLRLHEPDDQDLRVDDHDEERAKEEALNREVDRILAKISTQGEASLSRRERRTLQNASREFQRRRQREQQRGEV